MSAMASQITSFTIVNLTVYWRADQRKHQSSASLAFVRGIHRWPVNSPHKGPVTRKMFPFDDVIMFKLCVWLAGSAHASQQIRTDVIKYLLTDIYAVCTSTIERHIILYAIDHKYLACICLLLPIFRTWLYCYYRSQEYLYRNAWFAYSNIHAKHKIRNLVQCRPRISHISAFNTKGNT